MPKDEVTVYAVISEPPFEAGGVQKTLADELPMKAETPVGASGIVEGVTASDEEAEEVPAVFIDFTVNVIRVPLVRLVKVVVKTLPSVTAVPTDGVTKYPVISEPACEIGAVQDTVAVPLPATAKTLVGAPGSDPVGVDVIDEDSGELPTEFIDFTVNDTGVPLVRLLTLAVNTLPTVTGLPTDGVTVYPVIAEPPSDAGGLHDSVTD